MPIKVFLLSISKSMYSCIASFACQSIFNVHCERKWITSTALERTWQITILNYKLENNFRYIHLLAAV